MAIPISFPNPAAAVDAIQTGVQASGASGFKNILASAVQQVENATATADQSVNRFLTAANQELHSTILAVQKADLQFELFMQARNKVVSAYEEIMRMQI